MKRMIKKYNDQSNYVTTHQFGIFIEHLDDQFQQVIEVVDVQTAPISQMAERIEKMSEKIETLEHSAKWADLNTASFSSDLKLLKIRTEKLDKLLARTEDHEKRISTLEVSAA